MFRIIEGSVTLTDDDGNSLSTISGAGKTVLETQSEVDTTVSGGAVSVREQNLDPEGYIKNSSHNMAHRDGVWSPFQLDNEGRLRIVSESAPHIISGSSHTGVLSDEQIPNNVVREDELLTASGIIVEQIPTDFISLTDTPSEYEVGKYLRTTSSGLEYESDYVKNIVYIQPDYESDDRLGSILHPFKHLYEAVAFINNTYTDGDNVIVYMQPGIYNIPYQIVVTNPAVKAIIGASIKNVILKPSINLLGLPFITCQTPIMLSHASIDASDNPEFATTSGSYGISVATDAGQIQLKEIIIAGMYTSVDIDNVGDVWFKDVELYDGTVGIDIHGESMVDADLLYMDGFREAHIHVADGSELYLGESEISTAYVEGIEGQGCAILAEGENTYVELFAGTNIWSCNQNIVVTGGAEVRVDNCVLEETTITPGIVQGVGSKLIIINSRAPLASDEISISSPEYCYINAFDSSNNTTTIGNGSQSDQTIFSFNIGSVERPTFNYHPDHNIDFRTLSFENYTEFDKAELYVSGYNGDTALGVHPRGDNAYNYPAHIGLVSIQDGVHNGWMMRKMAGEAPQWKLHNKNDVDAIKVEYDGTFSLLSGVGVNKILDEDDFLSNDDSALITQQSAKAYVDNNTYSSTALDAGQLDNRYYTEDEINTLSGILDSDFVRTDGTHPLVADWDAGDHEISAGGFRKGDIDLDLAGFTNITGILTGGVISINTGDNTKLDIESGKGVMVNMLDRDNPSVEVISWSAITISPSLSGIRSKYIGVQRTGPNTGSVLIQTNFTQSELRHTIILGKCWGNGTNTITGVGNYKPGGFSFGKSMQDIAYAIGSINITGNDFFPTASGSMLLSRTAGEAFRFAANFTNDSTSPNISNSTSVSGITNYQYHIQDQLYTETETAIDPNYYDLNGVKTLMPSGTWGVQYVYYFPVSNTTHVVYSQHYHNSYVECYDDLSNYNPVLNMSILSGSILRSILIVQQGCTDLTDTSKAKLFITSGIGTSSGGSTGGGITDHGVLYGLGDDDHQQYVLSNGTRGFSDKVQYNSHPSFSSDTELIDKKYADDLVSSLTTDHGSLTGLSDDDHPQYHNDARGDVRYYTKDQVNTISGAIIAEFPDYMTLATVQVHSTSSLALTTSYQNIHFEVLDVETESSVIERDSTNTERIQIKENGTYRLDYLFSASSLDATRYVYSRLSINGTTEIPGSLSTQDLYSGETHQQAGTCIANLSAGNYVTVQIMAASTPVNTLAGHSLRVTKLNGLKGDDGEDGAPGSGSTVTLKEEGSNVVNTPHSALNFIGDAVTVTDAGNGVANITISNSGSSESLFGTWYAWDGDSGQTGTNSSYYQQKATLSVTDIPLGYYRIGWYYEWNNNSTSYDFMARLQIDNTTNVMEQNEEIKDTQSWHTESGFVVIQLTAGSHYFDIDYCSESSNMTVYIRKARLEIWRVA